MDHQHQDQFVKHRDFIVNTGFSFDITDYFKFENQYCMPSIAQERNTKGGHILQGSQPEKLYCMGYITILGCQFEYDTALAYDHQS